MKSKNNSPELEKTRGSDRRLYRQKGALARFHIQTEVEWNDGKKPNRLVPGTYDDYVERKVSERNSLMVSIKASQQRG